MSNLKFLKKGFLWAFAATMCVYLGNTPFSHASGISNNILTMDATSQPTPAYGKAKMWAQSETGVAEMEVMDAGGNVTIISPHGFLLYQPQLADPLPWSYYSENSFIGKRINVDMSGAILALENLTGQKFIYVEDLPVGKTVNWAEWKASETARALQEAKQREIEKNPLIEIPFSEAWEEADETVSEEVTSTITKFRINWETNGVEPYETHVSMTVPRATGRTIKQLKAGVVFDETTGKCYRPRTTADVTIGEDQLPTVELPQWVKDRLPSR